MARILVLLVGFWLAPTFASDTNVLFELKRKAFDFFWLEAHPQTGYASILKHGVIGRGLNDYDRIFSILRGVNFQGWISIEDGEDRTRGVENLRLSVEFLREKMKEHGLP